MKRCLVLAALALSWGSSAVWAQSDSSPSQTPAADISVSPSETPPTETNSSPSVAVDPAVLEAELQRIAVMDRAKDAVLAVFSSSGRGGGSGVVISPDGYALTNFHVVKPCGNAMKCGMADGKVYDAVIVGIDPTGDVALIRLFGRDDFPHAELGDSDRLQPGDWCFAMGNPFLLATDFQPTVTYGIVSGVHRYQYPSGTLLEYADCIQTDASINPGNSGGPLFDAAGRLIGINGRGSFEKRGRVNVGVAYAISINQIKNFLGYLRSGRIVDHATLGAQVGTDAEGRVVVSNILEQSDAFRRGLRYDDELIRFGGRAISTPNGFKNVLGIYPKGWRIPMSFRRDGQRHDVLVRLRGLHGREELLQKAAGRPRQVPMPIPKPGDEPKGREPKDGEKPTPGEKPDPNKKPDPQRPQIPVPPGHPPIRMMQPKAPMPKVCKDHFEARRGYANYFFNKLNRDRVWKDFSARADFRGLGGPWTLSGKLAGGRPFRFRLTDVDGLLELASGDIEWTATDDLGSSLLPHQSGGLMPALHRWRRLAVEGPEEFGEVTYLGTLPLAGHNEPVDVLVGVHKDVECRFLFDPAGGHLLAIEFFPDEDVDPCEVYFHEYHQVDGRFLPGRIEVRIGDDPFATFDLQEFQFEKTAEKKP